MLDDREIADERRDRALLSAGATPSEAYEAFLLRPPAAMVLMNSSLAMMIFLRQR